MEPEDWDADVFVIWQTTLEDLPEGVYDEFANSGAADLFYIGWIATEGEFDAEERVSAREEFFSLMDDWGLDIADFDWDDWRDWYDAAA